MARVYLADDLRHERRVAVKVLRPELAAIVGAERFLAEIRMTAGLQHPHILPLFDSGEADGFLYYVMPYVEGESLHERLDREHQLPVDEALRIGAKVAEGLDYAHRKGVIHRDIKPANILLHDDEPVISDFGIALALSAGGAGRLTETGLSLGTPHYMSPEQATGDLRVGAATDIYALGCVLYEMLVGEPPYTGSTPQAVLGKVIAGEPASASRQRPSVPTHVDAAIRKALEKVPADRFPGARALAAALTDTSFRWPVEPTDLGVSRTRMRMGVVAAALVAVSGFGLWGWFRPHASGTDEVAVSRLVVPLGEGHVLAFVGGNRSPLAISPDGRRIAYVGQQGNDTQLYLRNLSESTVRQISGTEGARQPFFSPDGGEVAFFSGTELLRVPVSGGLPTPIADVPPFGPGARWFGGTWSPDGTILYSLGESLWRASAEGLVGPTEVVLTREPGSQPSGLEPEPEIPTPIKWPRFLPGGEHALISLGWEDQVGNVGIVEIESGRFRPLTLGGTSYYSPTGHLIVETPGERVSVVPFDIQRLAVTGSARPVLDGVARAPDGGAATFTLSETGTLVFARGGFERTIALVDRFGRSDPVAVEPRGYRFPSVAADGCSLAVTVDPRPSHIWLVDLCRETASPLTTDGYNLAPRFSHDGSRLAWSINPGVAWTTWPQRDSLRRLAEPLGDRTWVGNDALAAVVTTQSTNRDLVLYSLATGESTTLVSGPSDQISPSASPDLRWLAFVSDETGFQEVYVTGIDGRALPVQVSRGGGADPRWSPDGDELFYRAESWIVSAPVRTVPTFEVLGPHDSLFAGPYLFNQSNNWDVHPDGRFVMIRGNPNSGRQLEIVLNWVEELTNLAPNE